MQVNADAPDMDPAAVEAFRSGPWDVPETPPENRADAHMVPHGAHVRSFPPHMIRIAANAFPETPHEDRADAPMVPHGAHVKSFPPHMISFAADASRGGADVEWDDAHEVRDGLHQVCSGANMAWYSLHWMRHGAL